MSDFHIKKRLLWKWRLFFGRGTGAPLFSECRSWT